MNNADAAFFEIVKRKQYLNADTVEELQSALARARQAQPDLAVESFPATLSNLSDDIVKHVLKLRARHARRCFSCSQIYYLLPGERSRELACPGCGGTLQAGRIDGIRASRFKTERRTRVLEALGLIAGFPADFGVMNQSEIDDATYDQYFDSDPELTPTATNENTSSVKPETPDTNVVSEAPKIDYWKQAEAGPADSVGFQSHINMSEEEARATEKNQSEPEPEQEQVEKPKKQPQRFRPPRPSMSAPRTTAFNKVGLHTPQPTNELEQRLHPDVTVVGALFGVVFGILGSGLGCLIAFETIEWLCYAISPKLEALQDPSKQASMSTTVTVWGYVFIFFMLLVLPNAGTYFGSRFGLSFQRQWPVKDFSLRFALSLIGGMLSGLTYYELNHTLAVQGWTNLYRPVVVSVVVGLINYRILIGALNRTWNNITDRL